MKISPIDKFESWFTTARPGDIHTYYVGLLGLENKSKFHNHIKHTAWNYAVQGKVYLFQRKIEENKFCYTAVKASRYTYKLVPFDYGKVRLATKEKLNGQNQKV